KILPRRLQIYTIGPAIEASRDKWKSRRVLRARTRTEARPIHRSRNRHARAHRAGGVASGFDTSAVPMVRESGRNRTGVRGLSGISRRARLEIRSYPPP